MHKRIHCTDRNKKLEFSNKLVKSKLEMVIFCTDFRRRLADMYCERGIERNITMLLC